MQLPGGLSMGLSALLATAAAAAAAAAPPPPLPGCPARLLRGACLPGGTYKSVAVNGTAAGCCAACEADTACVAWSVDTARCPGKRCCSLKATSTQQPLPSANCTSGITGRPSPSPGPTPPSPPPQPAPPIPPPAPPNPSAPRPNIVFVLADDLGWYDTAIYNTNSPTKGIAALAAEGIRLDHMYVFRYCSPTRRSFLSGRFPTKIATVQPDGANMCSNFLPLEFTTLPEKLATAGFTCHHVGKGHEGYQTTDHLPINRGFSSHLGYLSGGPLNYFHGSGSPEPFKGVHDLWHNREPGWDVVPGMFYSANTYANESVAIIKGFSATASPSDRLFLYLPMQNVHAPYQMPPAFEAGSFPQMWDNTYANMLKLLDDAVVNVTTALREESMWDNTIFWFSADNGGIGVGNNHPLRGHKHDPWEGGNRATAFVAGGFVPAALRGTNSGPKLVHIADLYATFCTLAGVDPRDDVWMANVVRSIDGVDVWPLLTADGNGTQPRAVTPTTEGGIIEVVDDGGGKRTFWKLVNLAGQSVYYDENQTQTPGTFPCLEARQPDPPQPRGPYGPGRTDPLVNGCPVCNASVPCLFDLLNDPRETTNVASEQPGVVARLSALLAEANEVYVTGSLPADVLAANYSELPNRTQTWRGYEGPCWVRKDGAGVPPTLGEDGLWHPSR